MVLFCISLCWCYWCWIIVEQRVLYLHFTGLKKKKKNKTKIRTQLVNSINRFHSFPKLNYNLQKLVPDTRKRCSPLPRFLRRFLLQTQSLDLWLQKHDYTNHYPADIL